MLHRCAVGLPALTPGVCQVNTAELNTSTPPADSGTVNALDMSVVRFGRMHLHGFRLTPHSRFCSDERAKGSYACSLVISVPDVWMARAGHDGCCHIGRAACIPNLCWTTRAQDDVMSARWPLASSKEGTPLPSLGRIHNSGSTSRRCIRREPTITRVLHALCSLQKACAARRRPRGRACIHRASGMDRRLPSRPRRRRSRAR